MNLIMRVMCVLVAVALPLAVQAQTPTVTGVTPPTAAIGSTVTISGSNFGSTQGGSTVTFNGLPAVPTSWGASQIVTTVPGGATGFANTNAVLTRDGGYFNPTQNFTIALWVKLTAQVGSGNWRHIYAIGDTNWVHPYVWIGTGSGSGPNNVVTFEIYDGTDWFDFSTPAGLTIDQWHYLVLTYDAGAHSASAYVDDNLLQSAAVSTASLVEDEEALANDPQLAAGASGLQLGHFRNWQATLTSSEWKAEKLSATPVRTANLLSSSRLSAPNDVADTSGNSRHWTKIGTVTSVRGPLGPSGATAFGDVNALLTRDAAYFDPTQSFTFAAWVKLANRVGSGNYLTLYTVGDVNYTNPYVWIGTGSSGGPNNVLTFEVTDGTNWFDIVAPSAISVDQWHHIALTYAAGTTTLSAYLDGVLIDSMSASTASFVEHDESVGTDQWLAAAGAHLAHVRNWQTALTSSELEEEMASATAVHSTNLLSDSPLLGPATVQDGSGHGRHWTVRGAPAATGGPLVSDVGPIVVTVGGTPSNAASFGTVSFLSPQLSSLSPGFGLAGATVQISGAGFGAVQGGGVVKFNGVPASVSSWSATTIAAAVPATATTGPVTVTKGGLQSNGMTFAVGNFLSQAGSCSSSPGIIYNQNWSRGPTTGSMRSNGAHYESVLVGGSDPVDPLYPEILSSEAVSVVSSAGPNGENVLDLNPAEDYVVAGVVLGDFGSVPRPSGISLWDASEGCLSAEYKWTTTAWNQSYYNPLLYVLKGYWDAGFELSADIVEHGESGRLYLGYQVKEGASFRWKGVDSVTFTRAETENSWQTFAVRWKAGTVSGSNVESDGWLRVFWNGAVVYDLTNIPLILSDSAGVPGGLSNHLDMVWLGYYGLFGPVTNVVLANSSEGPLPIDPDTDPEGTVSYFHSDAVGSVRLITDAGGSMMQRYDYLPFGQEVGSSSTDSNNVRFAGKERDRETAGLGAWGPLDYLGARYYASQIGRFTTVDPVVPIEDALFDPQRWNRYTYVMNRPLVLTDPDGRCPSCIMLLQRMSEAAQRAASSPAVQRATTWVQTQGLAAWNWATRFFNSPAGQETVQTVGELMTGSQAPAALPFQSGDVIAKEFATGVGTVSMMAEAVVSGTTLHLKDLAVYPEGAKALKIGTKGMMELVQKLKVEARELGFTQLRITGVRLTGANPGREVDIVIDLTEVK
jgi:RHS repeat-associated protein